VEDVNVVSLVRSVPGDLDFFKIGPGARAALNFNCLRTPNQLFGENQLMGEAVREEILRLLRGGLKRDERDSVVEIYAVRIKG
jgi:hypothetical protein